MLYKVTNLTNNEVIISESATDDLDMAQLIANKYKNRNIKEGFDRKVIIRNTDTGEVL